jgi:hypothetical protein
MQPAADRRAKKLSTLSHDARKLADKLELVQGAIRKEGVALALVRFRERQGERGAIVDLHSAAGVLRAYAAILEASCRAIVKKEAARAATAIPAVSAKPTGSSLISACSQAGS